MALSAEQQAQVDHAKRAIEETERRIKQAARSYTS
jgi:hypothetical protein